jgi:peptidylprolyl isomerase domain and WD repeat-containing protein 1
VLEGDANLFLLLDMINMIRLKFKPKSVCWIHQKGQAQAKVAVSEADNTNIHIYDGRSEGTPLHTISNMHSKPVHIIEVKEAVK